MTTMTAIELVEAILASDVGDAVELGVTTQQEAGSNCGDSVVLVYEDSVVSCARIAHLVFGGGAQCRDMSKKWSKLHYAMGLPEDFTWETAILVCAAKTWAPHCMNQVGTQLSSWAYIMADHERALGRHVRNARLVQEYSAPELPITQEDVDSYDEWTSLEEVLDACDTGQTLSDADISSIGLQTALLGE